METIFIHKLDRHERQLAFLAGCLADFPAASPGGKKIAALKAEVARCKTLAADQDSENNFSRMHVDNKDEALEELYALIKKINRAAFALDDEIPNLKARFRMPRTRGRARLLAAARSYYTDSEGYESEFIALDLAETFRAELAALIEKVEQSATAAAVSVTGRGRATSGVRESIRLQSRISDHLDRIVRNKYEWDPSAIAAWEIASHLERPPRRVKKEEPK